MGQMSLRGFRWAEPQPMQGQTMPGVPDEVLEVAVNRGITDFEQYFSPSLSKSMPDPLVLKDMDLAIARCLEACQKGQKVCVFGDYDVDGATSGAILKRILQAHGCEVTTYIPERISEGYGPNVEAMQKIAADKVDLLIVADSGTVAFGPLEEAERLGMDIFILDHHLSQERHPPGILVNPNRLDETGEYSYLCTAGLAFLFAVGLRRALRDAGWYKDGQEEYPLHDLMGIAALGTVADVVPLVGFNRDLVKLGLRYMCRNPGLLALARELDEVIDNPKKPPSEEICGFRLGPCINAAGRVDSTKWGIKLLTSDDEEECAEIAEMLVGFNTKRRSVQKDMEAGAYEIADGLASTDKVIVAYDESWHPGVIGIVASRIKERFDRPAVVIGQEGKGSGRSVEGYDLGSALMEAHARGILKKGGGHAMAAGLTIDPKKLDEFRAYMQTTISDFERPPLEVDLVLHPDQLTPRLIGNFDMLAPFGARNPKPRVVLKDAFIWKTRKIGGDLSVKATIKTATDKVEVVLFNSVGTPMGDALLDAEGSEISIYGQVEINDWKGQKTVQIRPEDFMIKPRASEEGSEQAA